MDKRLSLLVLLAIMFLIGQASATVISKTYGDGWQQLCYNDGKCAYSNYLTYKIYNGTYVPSPINHMTYWNTGYDIFWNGGLLQTVWDGVYAYDKIAYPENGTAISPWTFWHVESYNPTNKKWGETIPVSNQFIKIDNNTLKRVMTMGSGEKFNITYNNEGTRIKQDLELTAALARQYRLTYRIDSVAAQDVSLDTKKFTPGFFNNFTLFDITDVLPYTVNETTGAYLFGWNTTATIDNTNRKMYFTLTNDQVMTVGQTVRIDPSWTVGTGGNAWSPNNTIYDQNGSMNHGNQYNTVGVFKDTFDDNNVATGWNTTYKGTLTYTVNEGQLNVTDTSLKNTDSWLNYPAKPRSKGSAQWKPNFTLPQYWEVEFNISTLNDGVAIYQLGVMASDSNNNMIYSVIVLDGNTGTVARKRTYIDWLTAGTEIDSLVEGKGTIVYNSTGYHSFWNDVFLDNNLTATATSPTNLVLVSGSYQATAWAKWIKINHVIVWALNSTGQKQLSSNFTHYYDFGTGRRGLRAMINYTTGGTVNLYSSADNITYTLVSGITNATWSSNFDSGDKNQTQYIKVELICDNAYSCPEEISTTIEDESTLPNITSWGNNYTNNASLSLSATAPLTIQYNATANQNITNWYCVNASYVSGNDSTDGVCEQYYSSAGTYYPSMYGSNANGSALNSVNWTIEVETGEVEAVEPAQVKIIWWE